MKRIVVAAMCLAVASCGDDASRLADSTGAAERRVEATEWFLRSISTDGRNIAFVYQMSGVASDCQREATPAVDESSERVVIAANRSVTLDRDRACTEELAYVDETVGLAEPLGDRSLVGCRPGKTASEEDEICRDLERSRNAGVFEFSPTP
jgi:hypothetical protein